MERGRLKVRKPIPYFVTVFGKEEDGWHRGCWDYGSKLRDQFHRPTAVLYLLMVTLDVLVFVGLLVFTFFEHLRVFRLTHEIWRSQNAAGFDVPVENIEEAGKRLNQYVIMHLTEDALLKLSLRAQCSPRDIDLQFANDLQRMDLLERTIHRPFYL